MNGRRLLVLAAASLRFSDLFQRVIHTSWLGPGLILAVFIILLALLTRPADKSQRKKGLVRRFRTPRLERYRGAFRKNHQDLEM